MPRRVVKIKSKYQCTCHCLRLGPCQPPFCSKSRTAGSSLQDSSSSIRRLGLPIPTTPRHGIQGSTCNKVHQPIRLTSPTLIPNASKKTPSLCAPPGRSTQAAKPSSPFSVTKFLPLSPHQCHEPIYSVTTEADEGREMVGIATLWWKPQVPD